MKNFQERIGDIEISHDLVTYEIAGRHDRYVLVSSIDEHFESSDDGLVVLDVSRAFWGRLMVFFDDIVEAVFHDNDDMVSRDTFFVSYGPDMGVGEDIFSGIVVGHETSSSYNKNEGIIR